MELEAIKKTIRGNPGGGKPRKEDRNRDKASPTKIQEMEERISSVEDRVEVINTSVEENVKTKKSLTQNT